ncbi:MAG TPA: hypothetical protein V6D05_10500, partial [Stenomitos sp.]
MSSTARGSFFLALAGAALMLSGCGLGSPQALSVRDDGPLMARYRSLSGESIETQTERLQVLKQLSESGSAESEGFVLEALGEKAAATDPVPTSPQQLAIWSEFLPFDKVAAQLPALKARGLVVHVALTPDKAQDPQFIALLEEG